MDSLRNMMSNPTTINIIVPVPVYHTNMDEAKAIIRQARAAFWGTSNSTKQDLANDAIDTFLKKYDK